MKKLILLSVILLAMVQVGSAQVNNVQTNHHNPQWETPLIKGYGPIKYYSSAKIQPDKSLDYKVVFKITDGKIKDGVDNHLWHMARLLNLLYAAGVKPDHIHIVGVIAGKSTPVILNNKAYQKRFHKNNPNMDLLKQLTEHGVKIYVCDQAVAEHGIDLHQDLNKYIVPTLSAIIDLPTFQLKGYALMP